MSVGETDVTPGEEEELVAYLAGKDETKPGMDYDVFKRRLQALALKRGDVFGYPIPVDVAELVVAKNFAYQGLNGMQLERETSPAAPEAKATSLAHLDNIKAFAAQLLDLVDTFGPETLQELLKEADQIKNGADAYAFFTSKYREYTEVVNSWQSRKRGHTVQILRKKASGKITHEVWATNDATERFLFNANTMMAGNQAWNLKAELRAMKKLKSMLTPARWSSYLMLGQFGEQSKRSKVLYLFRRCRPVIALSANGKAPLEEAPLVALCMHPLAHYQGTFAGAMVPTDDIIAHLLLMRADERKYWSKCNQHPLWRIQSGI